MDAVIVAGGIPEPDDLLYPYTRGKPKALLEIAGKPMIQWVLDALSEAKTTQNLVVVGLEEGEQIGASKPLKFVPDQGSMLNNIRVGVQRVVALNPQAEFILVLTADIPAITGEMVDWAVNKSLETEEDIYYSVIPREVMEARFPGSNRSYIRLRDMEVCGGDMNVIRAAVATDRDEIWDKLIAARKNVFKQAALVGYDTLVLLLLRRLTLEKIVSTAANRLGVQGRAVVSPYAEVGMDVDKPYQLNILRSELEGRSGA
jgi:GTP:adenosylcobinamide-phosphate guanylyltransferase